jgi:4-hydroxybenzoyl-CoA thioesterase
MLVSTCEIRVEFGDCDPAGIVYYPRYLIWFDICTARAFEAATGLDTHQLLKEYDIAGLPMVDVRAVYRSSSRFGDTVTVETRVPEFGNSSFKVEHRLMNRGVLAVECFETRVWTVWNADEPGRLKPAPVPGKIREAFAVEDVCAAVPVGVRR